MSGHALALIIAFVLVTAGATLATLYLTRLYRGPEHRRAWLQNCSLLVFTVLYTVLVLEIVVKVTFVQSDLIGFTLSSKQWFARYWKPINSFGFRDPEYDFKKLRLQKRLFMVGDSFVAGHGIADISDRMGNVVARNLGGDWVVINMARNGWDTKQELEAMKRFPLAPQAVVLSYVFNDVEGVSDRLGLTPDYHLQIHSRLVREAVGKSYLLNLLYWRFYWRLTKVPVAAPAYQNFLRTSFREKRIYEEHRSDLLAFIDFARQARAPLIVVVFPSFIQAIGSRGIIEPVFRLFEEKGVDVIDLAKVLEGREPDTLMVNPLDPHPNEAVHLEVGNLIYKRLRAAGIE